jgi:hypothetical protein
MSGQLFSVVNENDKPADGDIVRLVIFAVTGQLAMSAGEL